MNHAHQYCHTLENVTKEQLVNVVHAALMQLYAIRIHEELTVVDNKPVILDCERMMRKAGHIGFTDGAEPTADPHREYHIQH